MQTEALRFEESRLEEVLEDLLYGDGFDQEQDIPDWFMDFFYCILTQTEKDKTRFTFENYKKCDPFNFIADLHDVVDFELIDTGEDMTLIFYRLSIKAYISLEDDIYLVSKI